MGQLYSPHASQCSTRANLACTFSSGLTGCSIWTSCIALMLASVAPEQVQHAHIAPALLVAANTQPQALCFLHIHNPKLCVVANTQPQAMCLLQIHKPKPCIVATAQPQALCLLQIKNLKLPFCCKYTTLTAAVFVANTQPISLCCCKYTASSFCVG